MCACACESIVEKPFSKGKCVLTACFFASKMLLTRRTTWVDSDEATGGYQF